MKILQCQRCGASDFEERNGYRICKYCNTSYQMYAEDKVTKETNIGLDDDIQRLLKKCKEEPWNAKKYANLILDLDASNKEALKYL